MSGYGIRGRLGLFIWIWVGLALGAGPVAAQPITEAWVAEQLGGPRRVEPPAPGRDATSGLPTLSLVIRYRPETGELTPDSAQSLRPLYEAVKAFAPAPFRMVCCDGLPVAETPGLAQQLVAHMSRLFAGHGGQIQFDVQTSPTAGLPPVGQANSARLDVYRLP